MTTVSRVALVTGGNSDLGLETARQLAARGLRVLHWVTQPRSRHESGARYRKRGRWHVQLDVTSNDDVAACRNLIEDDYGRLDVLVNNAAIHYDSGQSVLSADLQIAREALETEPERQHGGSRRWRCHVHAPPTLRAHRQRVQRGRRAALRVSRRPPRVGQGA